jgi:hypothetical protein
LEQQQTSGLPAVLAWTYNPWRDKSGPPWRRPQFALLLTLVVAVIAGVTSAYPNFPHSYIEQLLESSDTGMAPAGPGNPTERALTPEELKETREILDAVEHWPQQAVGWVLLSLLFLLGMTFTLYLPAQYRLDKDGVNVRFAGTNSFRKWSHYRNYYFHDTGVHLTTMPRPSPLDPFRGHFLRYSGNSDAVKTFITEHMAAWKGQPAVP